VPTQICESDYLRRQVRLFVRLFVHPSTRVKQLGSYTTDFHEIWYVSIFRKPVEKIQVSWTSDKNNGYFTWRAMYNYDISHSYS